MFRVVSGTKINQQDATNSNQSAEVDDEGDRRSGRIHALDCFCVPDNFDYTKSTRWNYSMKSPRRSKNGATCLKKAPMSPNKTVFDGIRNTRDTAWHGSYTTKRRRWQDAFVDSMLGRDFAETAVRQKHPWAILTCGAYGAGKGYVRRWMEKKGIIPLRDIVHIDPDYFKSQMPEWEGYLRVSPELAGSLTHRESGYIQEIVTELAMGAGQHVWLDGSLRNVDWFEKFLQSVLHKYPSYQIAIVRVFADKATIVARAEQRGKVTGRQIPLSVLHDSIRAVSRDSIRKLSNYADIVAHVDNSSTPILHDVFYGDRIRHQRGDRLSKTWEGLSAGFRMRLAPHGKPDDPQVSSSESSSNSLSGADSDSGETDNTADDPEILTVEGNVPSSQVVDNPAAATTAATVTE